MRTAPTLVKLWQCVRVGTLMSVALSLVAVVVFLIGGEGSFASLHTSFAKAVLVYLVGGVIARTIVGVLQPLARWKAGAAIVGFIASLPVAILFRLAAIGDDSWSKRDTGVSLLFAATLGTSLGVAYRDIFLGADGRR